LTKQLTSQLTVRTLCTPSRAGSVAWGPHDDMKVSDSLDSLLMGVLGQPNHLNDVIPGGPDLVLCEAHMLIECSHELGPGS